MTEADPVLQTRVAQLERRVAESEREFSTLMEIARTVASTLDLESLLAVILDQLQSLIAFDAAGIILEENDVARFCEYRGPIPRDLILSWRFPKITSGYQMVAQSQGAVLVGDMRRDETVGRVYRESLGELYRHFADVRSWLAVPLMARGAIIGFLRLSHTRPNFFTPQHARLAEAIAGHAAIAIENARLIRAEHARLAEVERRREVAESLRGILAILNSNTPSDQVLDYILDRGCRLLATDTATIYRLNAEGQILSPRATRNIPSELIPKLNVRVGEGAVGQAVLQRRPFILTDFDSITVSTLSESDLAVMVNWVRTHFKVMLAVPLLIKDEVYGGITWYFRESRALTLDDTPLAMSFADQAALAIENARLYSQVSDLASLEERQRLARELHDSVSQALYGIQLGAQTARELLNDDSPAIDQRQNLVEPLDYVLSLAEAGLAEMRALIFELRPEALQTEGLVEALTKQANALRVRHHLQVKAEFGEEPDLTFEGKETLYRIAQEALYNVVKHAHATKVSVQLRGAAEGVELCIEDNGSGFDSSATFPGHLGLRSMRERAARLDGTLDVESEPGGGTRVVARIPQPRLDPNHRGPI